VTLELSGRTTQDVLREEKATCAGNLRVRGRERISGIPDLLQLVVTLARLARKELEPRPRFDTGKGLDVHELRAGYRRIARDVVDELPRRSACELKVDVTIAALADGLQLVAAGRLIEHRLSVRSQSGIGLVHPVDFERGCLRVHGPGALRIADLHS
jgi:hypothetical protein